jgi:hypothetical protein
MTGTPTESLMTERAGERSGHRVRWTVALVLGIVLVLGACRAPWGHGPPPWLAAKHAQAWAAVDRDLSGLGPDVGLLVAQVAPGGTCLPIHQVAPITPRPTASQFKLFVLGALAQRIAAGAIAWTQPMTVSDAVRSLGNGPGSFQTLPAGTVVTVEQAATNMISISDNTAADMLIGLVGRDAVEAQMRQWTTHASANEPFLTTREMFLLHYAKGLADQYLATPRDQRDAFLASSVDPLPLAAIASGLSVDPRFIDTIEWFASPLDVCRAFAGLQRLARNPVLAPLATVLSLQTFGIALDRSTWPTLWYKGGSEPGVLTLGWLATDRHGRTFVVEAMVSDPDAVLADDSIPRLVAVAEAAFDVLDEPAWPSRR